MSQSSHPKDSPSSSFITDQTNTPKTTTEYSNQGIKISTNLKKGGPPILNQLEQINSFRVSKDVVWVMRLSHHNMDSEDESTYLATGGSDGVLKIWKNLFSRSSPIRQYMNHQKDILDISWCGKEGKQGLLATCSSDKSAIIYNIEFDKPIAVIMHSDIVTSISFHPKDPNIIATNSFDKYTRVWDISKRKTKNYFNTATVSTALQYSPDGQRLAVGSMKGECIIFDTSTHALIV